VRWPCAGRLHGPLSATGDETVAAMNAVDVDAAIIVSTFNLYRYDASYSRSKPIIRGRFAP
jgi:L-fuconolactonase